ncbi:MAG: hypothetical protein ACRC3H_02175 [Lachnospiraceae bacterium]
MYQVLTREFLSEQGCLETESFEMAKERYAAVILHGTEEAMKQFLLEALAYNEDAAYVDFYYPVLKTEEQQRFLDVLNAEERKFVTSFEADGQNMYYQLDKNNLPFLAEVTAKELLFSTFYFAKEKTVVWGNYGLKYPLFCESSEVLERYKKMAERNNLTQERL